MRRAGTLEDHLWPQLFPERSERTADEVRARMCGLQCNAGGDERRHFRLLVPAGFRLRAPDEAPASPGLLASVVSDEHPGAEISVVVDDLPREVAPADWTWYRLERAGHQLLASREDDTPVGTMADLLTRVQGPRGPVLARSNMAKDGKRIFTITCQAPEHEVPAWARDFHVVLASFALLQPERAPLAEGLASYCQLDPAIVGFSYPASWSVREEAVTPDQLDVRLDSVAGHPAAGAIHASLRGGGSPRRLLADFLGRRAREGTHLDEAPELTPCAAPTGFAEAASLAMTGTHQGLDVELRALVLTTPAAILLLGTCGPTRVRAAADWMVCRRAFEIVTETAYVV